MAIRSMVHPLVLLLVGTFIVPVVSVDSDALQCNLNGIVQGNACVCDAAWKGPNCEYLNILPASKDSAGVYGYSPNVTSWGGNVIHWSKDGLYHMFVTEILGEDCGLGEWQSHSSVTHAIAQKVEGPYVKNATALPNWSHNPQVMLFNDTWYLFHIGAGDATRLPGNCTTPLETTATTTKYSPPSNGNAVYHTSASPYGPWEENYLPFHCNNPSPLMAQNGSFLLVCGGTLYIAEAPEGPYLNSIPLGASDHSGSGRRWEDPFLWQNDRGNFHLLFHTYMMEAWPAMSISGHGFSTDLVHWNYSVVEPYSYQVHYSDGSAQNFSTLERPKLIFDNVNGVETPVAITNGASSDWDAQQPCTICNSGRCSACKVTPERDWTYTLMRPIAT